LPTPTNDVVRFAVDSRARRYASAFAALLAILFDVAIPFDGNAHAATLTVDPSGEIQTIAQAATLAHDGDVVEILPGNYMGDVAVWTQKRLTIRGVAETPVLRANGRDAEGKAIWVVRDGDFVIENVAFEGARVADHNGAGIRFERGKLTVRRCRFVDNENGILTSNANDAELVIEDSVFAKAPRDRGPLKHLLYVGRIGRLQITGSRFHQGYEGHLIKSRARQNHIAYNLIYDANGGTAAYELEFPNGGLAYVIGNVIGQSATTTNPAVVSYGAEGDYWERNALYLVNNTLTSDARAAWFLRVASDRLPGDTTIVAVNNLTVGLGIFTLGAKGRFDGNYPLLSWALAEPEVLDFRLGASSLLRNAGVAPPVVDGRSLAPTAEFKLPVGTMPIVPRDGWTPGAFQSTDPSH
jgi:hypothetical protein